MKESGSNLIDVALSLALKAHAGQTDKAGKAYILHPLRLMGRMSTSNDQVVALLHDVLEDSEITENELLSAGIPQSLVDAVLALKRPKSERYSDFIDRVAKNPVATRVKIADIEDNINILRLPSVSEQDLARVKKYHQAWVRLTSSV